MPAPDPHHLLWIDLETTGLNASTDQILEVAIVLTGLDLGTVATFSGVIRPQGDLDDVLGAAPPLVQDMHRASGLTRDLRSAQTSLEQFDEAVAEAVRSVAGGGPFILAGNSVSFDRSFIEQQMPKLAGLLHYRTFDVRTVQILMDLSGASEEYAETTEMIQEGMVVHRALDDIQCSISRARAAVQMIPGRETT